jgi:hypothetical protein
MAQARKTPSSSTPSSSTPSPRKTRSSGSAKADHALPDGRPTEAQRRYLARGLTQPGGKLPLFDEAGAAIAPRTVESCMAHGWAEPWFRNPTKPDWIVCRLTADGYRILGHEPPSA